MLDNTAILGNIVQLFLGNWKSMTARFAHSFNRTDCNDWTVGLGKHGARSESSIDKFAGAHIAQTWNIEQKFNIIFYRAYCEFFAWSTVYCAAQISHCSDCTTFFLFSVYWHTSSVYWHTFLSIEHKAERYL